MLHKSEETEYHLIQHPMQFISCLNYTVPIIAIHHEYETLGVLEIVPP